MPRKSPDRRPTLRAVIPVSMPADDGKLVGRAATRLNQPLSTFLREAALERARAVLQDPASSPAVSAA